MAVPEVAAKHFGYRCSARAAVVVADGLSLVDQLAAALRALPPPPPPPPAPADTTAPTVAAAAAPGAADGGVPVPPVSVVALPALLLDLLYVDADSKDPSLGLSAPPKVPC
jgi:hypothetical protein